MATVPRDKNQEKFSILLNRLTTSNRTKTEKSVHFQAHFQASRKLSIDVSDYQVMMLATHFCLS